MRTPGLQFPSIKNTYYSKPILERPCLPNQSPLISNAHRQYTNFAYHKEFQQTQIKLQIYKLQPLHSYIKELKTRVLIKCGYGLQMRMAY